MFEWKDPNPAISKKLESTLLSGKRRLAIARQCLERRMALAIGDPPSVYVVTLNHYGSEAYIDSKGSLAGHVFEYLENHEMTAADHYETDQKLHQMYPSCFMEKMDDGQRKRGIELMGGGIEKMRERAVMSRSSIAGPTDDDLIIQVRFPDGDMVKLDGKTGQVYRLCRGCLGAYECPGKELPVVIRHQVDTQLSLMGELFIQHTTDKMNKLLTFQVSVCSMWRELRKKVVESLPKEYWKQWKQSRPQDIYGRDDSQSGF